MHPEPPDPGLWGEQTAREYDTPGTGMFAPEVLGPTVDRLVALAGGGPALELAIGTGRVAVPLAARGVPVAGIELSAAMLDQLRTKADEATIPVVLGDMATARAAGRFTLVYLVFNTISNLLTQSEQVECFRNAARHLLPGGRFVIELWAPVRLARRARPHGTARRVRPGVAARRLGRCALHRRLAVARVGVPAAGRREDRTTRPLTSTVSGTGVSWTTTARTTGRLSVTQSTVAARRRA